ncbi:MAG: alpha-galactosidase, partial [Candidatus Bathyarchaeia archaeon]
MLGVVDVLPPHLAESSLTTRDELLLTQRWLEAITSSGEGGRACEAWLDGWLSTSLPFSFRYGGQESAALLPSWKRRKGTVEEGSVREFLWTDPDGGLRLTWQLRGFVDYPAAEWLLWFENTGTKDTALIENIQALDLDLAHSRPGEAFILHGANGGRSLPDDFLPFSWRIPSPDATRQSEVQLGGDHPSSNRHLPLFNLETPEQRGVLVGVGWSGAWLTKVKVEEARLKATAGLKESRFILHPGERVRTPRILLLFWKGKRLHGHNMLRQVLHRYHVPRLRGELQRPLVSVNVCFTHHGRGGFLHQATEEKVSALVEPFTRIGVELFIIDAGWYRGEPWHEWTGDWKPDPSKYPRGLRPISEPLTAANIPFGLWFASESVSDNAPVR